MSRGVARLRCTLELIILPFCVPLLLLGYVIDALDERRERRRAGEREALDQRAWRETWFRLNGTPSAESTTGPRSLPPH